MNAIIEEKMTEKIDSPVYTGMRKYIDKESGYAIWLPSDWYRFDMNKDHTGVIFSPHADNFDTSFTAEKHVLKYKVTENDLDILREGFQEGLNSLPGIEIESENYDFNKDYILLEARFTFLEGEARRKRWVRNMYWGEGQLVFIAQGATVEEFTYWEAMFYNTMFTWELT
jgi:hypothetical protein